MFGILGLGVLLGMQHALEADHIAAVSTIAARRTDVGNIARHGLTKSVYGAANVRDRSFNAALAISRMVRSG
jgi:hypothetical protein